MYYELHITSCIFVSFLQLTFLDIPFIEYPHGSNRKSSMIIVGMSLSIPDLTVASSADEQTSLVKMDITSGSNCVMSISKVWSGSGGSCSGLSRNKV